LKQKSPSKYMMIFYFWSYKFNIPWNYYNFILFCFILTNIWNKCHDISKDCFDRCCKFTHITFSISRENIKFAWGDQITHVFCSNPNFPHLKICKYFHNGPFKVVVYKRNILFQNHFQNINKSHYIYAIIYVVDFNFF